MKLNSLQIQQLIAEVFSEACMNMNEKEHVKEFAEALYTFRQAIENGKPLKCLDELTWNKELYGNEPYIQYLASFQKQYFKKLTGEMIAGIDAIYRQSTDEGFIAWYHAYTDALVCWKDYVYHSLCNYSFPFTESQQLEVNELKKLNDFFLESDWPAAFPFFEKLATDNRLNKEHQSFLNLVLAEIIIYWKPAEDAIPFIEKAKVLWPENEDILITLGKFHVRKFEYEKGRELLFSAASRNNNKVDIYSYIGDSYKDEQNYTAAREWYNKAVNTNFLAASVYARFFFLGGEQANKEEINSLINYTEIIEQDDPISPILYNAYRDASFQFSTAGNSKEAINYCKKAIALRPELKQAKIDLAYEYFKAERTIEAIEVARKVVESDAANYNAWWALSYFFEMSGDIEQAEAAYHQCIVLRPVDKALINNMLGLMFKKEGKSKEAVTYFQAAISDQPFVSYYENLKSVYEETGDDEQIVSVSEKLANHPDAVNPFNYYNQLGIYFYQKKNNIEAIKYYQKAIEMKDGDPILHENIGLAYQAANDILNAQTAYQKAALLEKEKGSYHNRLGYFYYMLAFEQTAEDEKQKYFSQAIEWYLQAVEREPQNAIYIANTALAYEKMKLFTEGANWYSKVLQINPKDTNALAGIGYCSYMAGNYEEAVIHFNKAIEFEPWGFSFYDHLGYVYELQKKNTQAIETYQKALVALNDHKDKITGSSLQADYFHNRIGILLYNSGEIEQVRKSIDEYKKAIEHNSSYYLYHSNIALAYQYLGEYENAKEEYLLSIKLNSEDHNAYNSLGVMYYRMGMLEESINAYKEAISINQDIALYYDNIGLSYFEQKVYKEAEYNWMKAAELDPDNIIYLQSLQNLYYNSGETDKSLIIEKKINEMRRPD